MPFLKPLPPKQTIKLAEKQTKPIPVPAKLSPSLIKVIITHSESISIKASTTKNK